MRENNEITSIFNRQGKDHIVALLEYVISLRARYLCHSKSQSSHNNLLPRKQRTYKIPGGLHPNTRHTNVNHVTVWFFCFFFFFFLTLSINNSCIFCKNLTRKEIVPSFISFQFCSTFTAAKESGNSKFSFYLPWSPPPSFLSFLFCVERSSSSILVLQYLRSSTR